MSFMTKPVNLAASRIESGEQSRCAVTFVVMGQGLTSTTLQRQTGLCEIQGRDLAFLVHAQHQRMFRRIQIEANDVFQLFCELGIVADPEVLHPGRFQAAVTAPDPTHASLANA